MDARIGNAVFPTGDASSETASHTGRIAQALCALRFDDIPAPVVHHATRLIVDGILVAAGGTMAQGSAAILKATPSSVGDSSVWFARGGARHATDATFANTVLMAALDYDSVNGSVHADLVTLPAAWATAESVDADGKTFLTGYIAASELVNRLAHAAFPVRPGWTGTSLYGGIGAAAAAGKTLGLAAMPLRDALGLAIAQATGTQQANVEQVLSKKIQPALAARHGVFAAHLAQAGVTAPAFALDGVFGLRAMTQPGDDVVTIAALWNGKAEDWRYLNTSVKQYPVCASGHAALYAVLGLLEKYRIAAEDVQEVVVRLSEVDARLVGGFSASSDPQVAAQLSLPYQLASVLLRGRFGLPDIEPAAVRDAVVQRLIQRVSVIADATVDNVATHGSVVIRTASVGCFDAPCDVVPGSTAHPLTDAQWRRKWLELAEVVRPGKAEDTVDRLVDAIDALPHRTSIRGVLD